MDILTKMARLSGQPVRTVKRYYEDALKKYMKSKGKSKRTMLRDDYQRVFTIVKKRLGLKTESFNDSEEFVGAVSPAEELIDQLLELNP